MKLQNLVAAAYSILSLAAAIPTDPPVNHGTLLSRQSGRGGWRPTITSKGQYCLVITQVLGSSFRILWQDAYTDIINKLRVASQLDGLVHHTVETTQGSGNQALDIVVSVFSNPSSHTAIKAALDAMNDIVNNSPMFNTVPQHMFAATALVEGELQLGAKVAVTLVQNGNVLRRRDEQVEARSRSIGDTCNDERNTKP
ncbi:hypothetical protein NQ176_g6686 [Zarea fungicola]|uniref:Uncharacterized protein n=1 Tax=Zarea fungicola TaxID=93591 RepID=A0ACC1N1Z4_9HYPO|nr:hypothetical protein NQ176_g6686 [Lecanicillium fungicola]